MFLVTLRAIIVVPNFIKTVKAVFKIKPFFGVFWLKRELIFKLVQKPYSCNWTS